MKLTNNELLKMYHLLWGVWSDSSDKVLDSVYDKLGIELNKRGFSEEDITNYQKEVMIK